MKNTDKIKYVIMADQKSYYTAWWNDAVGLSDRSYAYPFNKNYVNPYFVLHCAITPKGSYFVGAFANMDEEASKFFKLFSSEKWSSDYLKQIYKLIDNNDEFFKKNYGKLKNYKEISKLDTKELYSLTKQLFENGRKTNSLNQDTHPQCTSLLDQKLTEWIKSEEQLKKYVKKYSERGLLELFLTSNKLTKTNKLRFELVKTYLHLIKKYGKTEDLNYFDKKGIISNIHKILADLGHVEASSMDGKVADRQPTTYASVFNEFEKVRKNKKYHDHIIDEFKNFKDLEQHYKEKERILSKIKIPSQIRHIINLIPALGISRINNHTSILNVTFLLNKIVLYIPKAFNVEFEDLNVYREKDILTLLKSGKVLSKQEVKKRDNAWVSIFDDKHKTKAKVLFGKSAFKNPVLKEILEERKRLALSKEIKGTIASIGKDRKVEKVIGRAYLFDTSALSSKMISDFPKDWIIVATQTLPNLMPAIVKCKGIIADEGGMTGHAAIVSRELKKSCIVGTKMATFVIKTGDLIEMNMRNGEIKILEKAN